MESIDAKTKTLREVNAILRQSLNGAPLAISDAGHLHGLGAGLSHGELIIQGGAGDYLGVLNAGATIRVEGDAGNYAADNMTAGRVLIQGNAGFGAAEYCYGGTVVIYGNAGDFTATMNKGATILVRGDVGDEAGTYMLAGKLVIVGNAGANLANYLIRGVVYAGGEVQTMGHNTKIVSLEASDLSFLRTCFEEYGITAEAERFRKIVAASERPFYH